MAVVAADRAGLLGALVDVRHVGQVDDLAGGEGDGDVFERFDGVVADAAAQGELLVAAVDAAGRDGEVGGAHEPDDRVHVELILLEALLVEGDADVVLLSAHHVGGGHARELFKLGLDVVVDEAEQVDVARGVGGEDDARHHVHADLDDGRGLGVVRQGALIHVELLLQIHVRHVHVGAVVHLEHDDRHVLLGLRGDVLDAAEARGRVLDDRGDEVVDLLGPRARIDGEDDHGGHLHVGHELERGPEHGRKAEDHQRQHDDEHRHRAPDRKFR